HDEASQLPSVFTCKRPLDHSRQFPKEAIMSEDAKTTPKAPRGIGTAGRKLWNDIVKDYDLRADELRVLAKACALEDHIAALQKGLEKAPLTVTGSQGQEVINPLYTEIRQQMSTQA